jgi:hypothetical protein
VEILVTLVILVFGMLAVARLFPQGFASLGLTASRSVADSLARENEEYLRKFRENLPDAIAATDRNTGFLRTDILPTNLNAEMLYLDVALAGGAIRPPEDPRYTGQNQIRTVLGEQFKVPPPSRVSYGIENELTSVYHVLFSPIYSAIPMGNNSKGVVMYSGTPLKRVVFQDPPSPENWEELRQFGPFGYGVNYETAQLYFRSTNYPRIYHVEFTSRPNSETIVQSPPNTTITVPADANGVGQVQRVGTGGALERGSDLVYRRLNQIPVGTAFSDNPVGEQATDDPFEYKVFDPIFGLLGVHPYLASATLPLQAGRGLVLRLDYDVDDWNILRHEATVPSEVVDPNSAVLRHSIRLPAAPIKKYLDTEDVINITTIDGQLDATFEYQGLRRFYPAYNAVPARAGTPGIDVVVVDTTTGYHLDSTTLQEDGDNTNGLIDYAQGVIQIADRATFRAPGDSAAPPLTVPTVGRRLRIYYRATEDYGVATFKPFANFTRQSLPNVLGAQEYGIAPYSYLLFANPQAERTVAIDYVWRSAITGEEHREIGELHRITAPEDPWGPENGTRSWVRVAHAEMDPSKEVDTDPDNGMDQGAGTGLVAPNDYIYDTVPNTVQILAVRGVSLETYVAWRSTGKLRRLERTTILTRELSR